MVRMTHDTDTLRAHLQFLDDLLFGEPEPDKRHTNWREKARAAWNALDDTVEELDSIRRAQALPDENDDSPSFSAELRVESTDGPPGRGTQIPGCVEGDQPHPAIHIDDHYAMTRRHNRRGHALAAIQSAVAMLLDSDECIPPSAALHFLCAILDVCVKARAFDGSIPSVANSEAR
jgi:hypothetical protein